MKRIKTIMLALIIALVHNTVTAQNFFHRVDIETGNLYTFVASNLLTAGINKLTDDRLLDTGFSYTWGNLADTPQSDKYRNYNLAGITARDLFSDVTTGLKLGYQTFSPGAVNFGIFGSAHYRLNQFKYEISDEQFHHRVQRVAFGGGVFFTFGSIEQSQRVIVEAALRYNIPIGYNGCWGEKAKDIINEGMTSHYSIRMGGFGKLQGLGIFVDIPHYNLLKNNSSFNLPKLRLYTIGITYTIMPWNV